MPSKVCDAGGSPLTWGILTMGVDAPRVFFSPAQYVAMQRLLGVLLFGMGPAKPAVELHKLTPPLRNITLNGAEYRVAPELAPDELVFTSSMVCGFIAGDEPGPIENCPGVLLVVRNLGRFGLQPWNQPA